MGVLLWGRRGVPGPQQGWVCYCRASEGGCDHIYSCQAAEWSVVAGLGLRGSCTHLGHVALFSTERETLGLSLGSSSIGPDGIAQGLQCIQGGPQSTPGPSEGQGRGKFPVGLL